VIARHKQSNVTLAVEEVTPLAVVGGLVLWLLRLTLAPASTLAGFRAGPSLPRRDAGATRTARLAAITKIEVSTVSGEPCAAGRTAGDTGAFCSGVHLPALLSRNNLFKYVLAMARRTIR
jgi:hypothetical protein